MMQTLRLCKRSEGQPPAEPEKCFRERLKYLENQKTYEKNLQAENAEK